MPDPHPIELRERVVRAYEAGEETYREIAARFCVGVASVSRWARRYRERGTVEARERGGGNRSDIGAFEVALLLMQMPDANADELTAEYNRRRRGDQRIHVSSMKRALRRHGYVVKKSEFGRWSSSATM